MKLINDLYKIVSSASIDDLPSFNIVLNKEHFIYNSHFPDNPITPCVCLIQIGKELLETLLHKELEVFQVKNVKFLSIVSPLEASYISYRFDKICVIDDGCQVKTQIVVSNKNIQYAKISMICK